MINSKKEVNIAKESENKENNKEKDWEKVSKDKIVKNLEAYKKLAK